MFNEFNFFVFQETRLADHFNGKMHLGMVSIREKYEEMKVIV